MSLIYLASPYSQGDIVQNVHRAIEAWHTLTLSGYTALVPHTSMLLHLVHPQPEEFWYYYTKKLMLHCDLVLRLPGESVGADNEVELARRCGIPVFEGTVEQFIHSDDMENLTIDLAASEKTTDTSANVQSDCTNACRQRPPIRDECPSKRATGVTIIPATETQGNARNKFIRGW